MSRLEFNVWFSRTYQGSIDVTFNHFVLYLILLLQLNV